MESVINQFNQKGMKFTMDDIAKQLSISKKTIYKVFDDKEKLPRVEKVRTRFMRDDECAETTIGLLLHWSAKETLFKVLGREGVNFVDEMQVSPFDETQYEGEFTIEDLKEDDTYIIYYKMFDDFVLTYTKKQDE